MSKASMINLDYAPKTLLKDYQMFLSSPVKRRAPLINRGYFIRYACIEYFKSLFLSIDCNRPLQILSLGCGYDPSLVSKVLFDSDNNEQLVVVECDLKDVISYKKGKIMESMDYCYGKENEEIVIDKAGGFHLSHYHLLECDLNETANLDDMFDVVNVISSENKWPMWDYTNPTLVISECVLTYLPVDVSDNVINWVAKKFNDCMFVYYEQIRPGDAFASQMLKHFETIGAPIHSIHKYPELDDQINRIRALGFENAVGYDMNHWWKYLLTDEERQRINTLEPFDEYEEWFLKCSHYFVGCGVNGSLKEFSSLGENGYQIKSLPVLINASANLNNVPMPFKLWGHAASLLGKHCIVFGGYGTTESSGSKEVHKRQNATFLINLSDLSVTKLQISGPPSRLYHRMCSDIDGTNVFCFGGRSSPVKPFSDLWVFNSQKEMWQEIIPVSDNHPAPRWNHGLVYLPKGLFGEEMGSLLVFGGRSHKLVPLSDFWLYSIQNNKWRKLSAPKGSPICSIDRFVIHYNDKRDKLIILGGMKKAEAVSDVMYVVDLSSWACETYTGLPIINAKGSVAPYDSETLFIVGGISVAHPKFRNSVFVLSLRNYEIFEITLDHQSSLFINHEIVSTNNAFVVIGGGATCFSMGSFFNRGLTMLSITLPESWRIHSPLRWINRSKTVPSVPYEEFKTCWEQLFAKHKPFVITGSDIGDCKRLWCEKDYLADCINADTKVSIHVSDNPRLKFTPKNYNYEVHSWRKFIDMLFEECPEKYFYFRSIGSNPRKHASDLKVTHPQLAKDFKLSAELINIITRNCSNSGDMMPLTEFDSEFYFSSILRMSTPKLQLWTHYDVMDNFLFQITGEKFITLIDPVYQKELNLPPGINQSSSPETDIFGPYIDPLKDDLIRGVSGNRVMDMIAECHTLILEPGDILFIPALWFHNVLTLDKPAISVNLFWKNLDMSLYDKKDLYGNKDLLPVIKAFQAADELLVTDLGLSEEYVKFYSDRLMAYIREKLNMKQ